jgi:hypothetical protein
MDEVESRGPSVADGELVDVKDLNGWLRYFGALPEDE